MKPTWILYGLVTMLFAVGCKQVPNTRTSESVQAELSKMVNTRLRALSFCEEARPNHTKVTVKVRMHGFYTVKGEHTISIDDDIRSNGSNTDEDPFVQCVKDALHELPAPKMEEAFDFTWKVTFDPSVPFAVVE